MTNIEAISSNQPWFTIACAWTIAWLTAASILAVARRKQRITVVAALGPLCIMLIGFYVDASEYLVASSQGGPITPPEVAASMLQWGVLFGIIASLIMLLVIAFLSLLPRMRSGNANGA